MTIVTAGAIGPDHADSAIGRLQALARSPVALFTAGAALWLLSAGTDFDIWLAAWLSPLFLLRFARTMRASAALAAILAASVAAAVFWAWRLVIPFTPTIWLACVAFGVVFTLPYLLDRLVGPRLAAGVRLVLFPAAIVACEYAMGTFSPLGTAFGLRAVTQYDNLPLLQVISLTGPYAIGFLIGLFATAANHVWERPGAWRSREGAVMLGGFAALLTVIVVGGALRMALFPPATDYVRVAGITPSKEAIARRAQALGGALPASASALAATDPQRLRAAYALVNDELLESTRRAAAGGAEVVVWSETAAMLREADRPALVAQAAAVARETGVYINVAGGVPFARNETTLVDPAGQTLWNYQKSHPVPGLEPVPPGKDRVPTVQTRFGRFSNVICYDADFPAVANAPADIMLVPGYDWPEMGRVHTLRMASLRAIENGYALVRIDFDGLSAAFDHQGRVLASQDTVPGGRHTMFVDVPVRGATTLYGLIGDVFAWLCVAGVLALTLLGLVRRRALG